MAEPDPWAKLWRANNHSAELYEAIEAFRAEGRETHRLEQVSRVRDGVEWQVIRCAEILEPLPIEWALIAGDAIHNMRSALDHLACALVIRNGNDPTNRTSFPIYPQRPSRGAIEGKLEGMAVADAEQIRAMQPYLDPQSDRSIMLLKLSRLDNDDKHKLVAPTYALSSRDIRIRVEPVGMRPPVGYYERVPVFPGTELLEWRSDSGVERVEAIPNFAIGFGYDVTSHQDLPRIRDCVGEICRSLGVGP